jgi:anaerobic ribonucleoside-triphosphate reductase
MILAKARKEGKDFYEVLDYYLELIRKLHLKTIDYFGNKVASTNPMMFMQGGCLGGHLKADEKIKDLLKPMTVSFGIVGLNELQQLYNGKSIIEDGQFALEVMEYINKKEEQFKKEDGVLYATYATPGEQLCLAGDTYIQTYEGPKMIKDVTTNDLVYSFNEQLHKIELKRVLFSGMTKRQAQVVRVTMDNGQTVTCTPNHPFAVRCKVDGCENFYNGEYMSYVEAGALQPGMRIKSNYIRNSMHGRPQCSIHYNGRPQLLQDINAEYFFGPKPCGYVIHHKDENKANNFIENLQYMSDADHRRLHLKDTVGPYRYTAGSQTGEKNSFYGKHHTEESKLKNRNAHLSRDNQLYAVPNDSSLPARFYACANDAEKDGYTRHLVKQACCGERLGEDGHQYRDETWMYRNEDPNNLVDDRAKSIAENGGIEMARVVHTVPDDELNHRVVNIEWLTEPIDVYDITVEDNHNFFVGGIDGMLVHNCSLQVTQFRDMFGDVEGVTDHAYMSNSFHCGVWENITPIQKQDYERRFWDLFNGGKIQYCRYPIDYNAKAQKTIVRRAMRYGFYEGCNLELCYCEDCGHEQVEMKVCPKCGSTNLTIIDRMNGYIGYTRIKNKSRYNEGKLAEISERVSM